MVTTGPPPGGGPLDWWMRKESERRWSDRQKRMMLGWEACSCDEIEWWRKQLFPCEDRLTEGLVFTLRFLHLPLSLLSKRLQIYVTVSLFLCSSSSHALMMSFPSVVNLADLALVPLLLCFLPLITSFPHCPAYSLTSYAPWPFSTDDKPRL